MTNDPNESTQAFRNPPDQAPGAGPGFSPALAGRYPEHSFKCPGEAFVAVELIGERDIENSGLCILEVLRSLAQAAADEVVERAVVYGPVEKTCEVKE